MDNDSLNVANPPTVLAAATVIGQADNKFILCQSNGQLIVIDQHAADERIRLERFYGDLSAALVQISGLAPQDAIARVEGITLLMPPVRIALSPHEYSTVLSRTDKFRRLGFVISQDAGEQACGDGGSGQSELNVMIECTPTVLAPRFTGESRRAEGYAKELVMAVAQWEPLHGAGGVRATNSKQQQQQNREPVELDSGAEDGWPALANVPPEIVESLKSIACRGAIKFNDALSHSECSALVRDLARCRFAGFCAHG
ncbi:DNA mismatch repair protein, partial [Linderina macrospora]